MSQLPLQIRKDIRDLFEKDDGAVQKSFVELKEIVGYPVSCTAEWHMLWAELESLCPDKATFVPTIAKLVEAWCHSLGKRLEDDSRFEAWTELFLERLKLVNFVKLSIQVAAYGPRVRTAWSGTKSTFIILLPKTAKFQTTHAASAFAEDFESIFDPPTSSSHDQEAVKGHHQIHDDEDWAELESVPETKSASISISTTNRVAVPYTPEPNTDVLPSLETLPRPEILFQTTTPYLMVVSSNGLNKVTVNATHEPSLRLLAEYLKRWIRTDPQDVRKIPYLRIKLNESSFGFGLFSDSLTIEPFDHYQRHVVVNVALILTFIQGVLGYQRVIEMSGAGNWEFRRDTPFAA
ncbi:uncharacterized protein Z519_09733 [Cladophialophora bantiana CBS 173.52]|uniref:Uncharacterized protein n=1 Tax=Cladophialophora bantiana (strain ATCC 10958 / CBS 173.52 / CDC B-1940 / NIH 8579) TaxID=1442370 RepID=A0A0D2FSP6_CLAB1|nr:uncharacterized protein Z519_09733 [Cladophialophora bantiana CBS 173.52]KIW89577.1 hypothetical protein Z519_09733 [Cladophialophora bantiana CBS 173.52]